MDEATVEKLKNRAMELVREHNHTCTGYPCDPVRKLCYRIAKLEAELERERNS